MYPPVLTSAPASTPVSLTEAKAHLRVDHSDEDDLITLLIETATEHLDGWAGILGRCLVTQTWRQDYDDFYRCLRLPFPDVSSVSSVDYTDSSGSDDTIASANYQLLHDARGSYVRFDDDYSPPSDLAEVSGASITFVAGYGAASSVPSPIKAAILLMVGHWYENREAVTAGSTQELPMAVYALLTPYRRTGV